MKKIEDIIFGFDIFDVRAAFYYLGRYLKQADYFAQYEKDFFEDNFQSVPSDTAKNLTFALIEFIEQVAGKKASEFTDEEYIVWLDVIDEVESKLDPEPSKDIIEAADSTIEGLSQPKLGKNSE